MSVADRVEQQPDPSSNHTAEAEHSVGQSAVQSSNLQAGNTPENTSGRLLLVTKFAMPPVRSDLIPRPRLVNQLQPGIQRPLTLIAAPAGFGKTTLISTWLEHIPLRFAWLSLEHDDDDLIRFWSYVFAAISRVHQGSEASATALLQTSPGTPTLTWSLNRDSLG
jgi:ATP/maltotriose-dependent transcriptional regulator MalT